jgi:hypothetical protein
MEDAVSDYIKRGVERMKFEKENNGTSIKLTVTNNAPEPMYIVTVPRTCENCTFWYGGPCSNKKVIAMVKQTYNDFGPNAMAFDPPEDFSCSLHEYKDV